MFLVRKFTDTHSLSRRIVLDNSMYKIFTRKTLSDWVWINTTILIIHYRLSWVTKWMPVSTNSQSNALALNHSPQ